jgi:hypothetical protein
VDEVRKRPALLLLWEAGALDEGTLARLVLAAQPASELVHPHLAWTWESGVVEGQPYLAERWPQGAALSQRLNQGEIFSWQEAHTLLEHATQGLEFAQARGWVHGGLSAHTVWGSPELGYVLSGWGWQRGLRQVGRRPDGGESIAPEVLQGRQPTPASDVYSLAALVFQMLTGAPPFPGWDGLEERPLLNFPVQWPQGTPWEIERVLALGLGATPEGRYSRASDLLKAIDALPQATPVHMAQREAAVRERQAAEAQARMQSEETLRLAALEQARREIDEQVQRAEQAAAAGAALEAVALPAAAPASIENPAAPIATPGDAGTAAPQRAAATAAAGAADRPAATGPLRASPWVMGVGLVAVVILIAALWWGGQSGGGQMTPTPAASATPAATTQAAPAVIATQPALTPTSAVSSPAPTATQPAPTTTRRATVTPTLASASGPSPTATQSPTSTRKPTATRTPREPGNDNMNDINGKVTPRH